MTSAQILGIAQAFLHLLEHPPEDLDAREKRLPRILDELALGMHDAEPSSLDDHAPDPEARSYDEWRRIAAAAFPELGYYNVVMDVASDHPAPKVAKGDAHDDLADIAGDLEETCLRAAHSVNDALWYLRWSYQSHWCAHLRNLQLYLCMRQWGG